MNRCACKKPDCSPVANDLIMSNPFIELGKNTLHFKPADRECFRCGRGLCGNCRVLVTEPCKAYDYCRVCAQDVEEKN